MLMEIIGFPLHRFGGRAARQLRQRLLQLADDFDGRFVFQLFDQRLEPGFEFGLIAPKRVSKVRG